jgi:hypothetical protein
VGLCRCRFMEINMDRDTWWTCTCDRRMALCWEKGTKTEKSIAGSSCSDVRAYLSAFMSVMLS